MQKRESVLSAGLNFKSDSLRFCLTIGKRQINYPLRNSSIISTNFSGSSMNKRCALFNLQTCFYYK